MDIEEDNAAAVQAGNPPTVQPPPHFFKLPDFWTASPATWFGVDKAQFLLCGTATQRDRFALVVTVLPEASACRVAHILAAPGNNCYDDLRATLLVAHQLTAFQKTEKLFPSEPLGSLRPSKLLSEMLEPVHPRERSGPASSPCCSYVASLLQSACNSLRMTKRTFAPWLTRLKGAPPPFTAISSCCRFALPPPTTAKMVRSSPTSPSPLWAPTEPPQRRQRWPEAPVQQQLLSAGAQPDTAGQAGWSMLQPLHLRRPDLQLRRKLFLVGKLSFPGGVNAIHPRHLVFLKDHTTGAFFLTDIGALVSLVPGQANLHMAACSLPPRGRHRYRSREVTHLLLKG